MKLLSTYGISHVYHFAPLHYLPFIARTKELMSKPRLEEAGYVSSHFRSTSAHIDRDRGFGRYVHLSTSAEPPILKAKLAAGFPHFGLALRTNSYLGTPYDLCRFNIAKTRYLRREGKPGFAENDANGRYYGTTQIPIARSEREKTRLLGHRPSPKMIEVLVDGGLHLDDDTAVRVYRNEDLELARAALDALDVEWDLELVPSPAYPNSHSYRARVEEFIEMAMHDQNWMGNGLEFDRV